MMKDSAVRRLVLLGIVSLLALTPLVAESSAAQAGPAAPKYPPTARGPQADDIGGVHVADPYRWLENVASPDVHAWIAAQNAATDAFLAQLPRRKEIQDRVARAWTYPKLSAPFGGGERLYYFENSGVESQPALYVQDTPKSAARVLIDPNAFSRDGLIAIVDRAASPDGRYLAYAVSTQGSAWRVVRVRDVRSGQDTGEELQGVKDPPLSWTRDERGFFYVRSDVNRPAPASNPLAPDGRQRVFYHRVGRPQADDDLVYEDARHPDWLLRADVSEDGQYLVIAARVGAGADAATRLYFIDLDNPKRPNLRAPLVKLFDDGDAMYEFVANSGPVFFIRTTKNAPRARLVAVDINAPDETHWTPIVRETYDPLVSATRVDDRFVAHRIHDAHSVLELYTMDGGSRGVIPLPGVGTVSELNARGEYRELYFSYSSFIHHPVVFRYDLDTKTTFIYKDAGADSSFSAYETTQLYFTSKDGTRVPMFLTARRGITLDGSHPTLLTGVGSLGADATPAFSPAVAAWLEMGGVYAVANVRGGGEYGRAWHEAGAGAHKQTGIDDFLAAAQFLIDQRYTRAPSLGVVASGLGGLIAGAAITQRPELFGAGAIDGGLLDMARFSRFTIGARWIPEFGSPDRPTELRTLLAYSPLHEVRSGVKYPSMLVSVGEHDEVATAAHSYKFAAALQWAGSSTSPALLRVEYDAGAGPGTPAGKRIALDIDQLSFLANALHAAR
jgi:prolyl oligopeptidase